QSPPLVKRRTAARMAENHEELISALYEVLPDCRKREQLVDLVRTGAKFKRQQTGRRRGALSALIAECTKRCSEPPTFAKLLVELELEAMRRAYGYGSIVEKVDREFELLTYHDPKAGRQQRTFSALEYHFTCAKKY